MAQELDKEFWETHWQQADASEVTLEPNPHLQREVSSLAPGKALDAGCGEGAEAIWLSAQGWQVTAADISTAALSRGAERADAAALLVQWVEADLGVWEPGVLFDLVTTHYAHPAIPQLEFYKRISDWVAPGGTLLIVGHLHDPETTEHAHGAGTHGNRPFDEASVTTASVVGVLDQTLWNVVTAEERTRDFRGARLRDVVVRAIRR